MLDGVFNFWGTKNHWTDLIFFSHPCPAVFGWQTFPVEAEVAPGEGYRRFWSQSSLGHGLSEPLFLSLFKEQEWSQCLARSLAHEEDLSCSLSWLTVAFPPFAYIASSSPHLSPHTCLFSSVVFPVTLLSPSGPQQDIAWGRSWMVWIPFRNPFGQRICRTCCPSSTVLAAGRQC